MEVLFQNVLWYRLFGFLGVGECWSLTLKGLKQFLIITKILKKLDQRKFDAIPELYKYGFLIKTKRIFILIPVVSSTVDFYSS